MLFKTMVNKRYSDIAFFYIFDERARDALIARAIGRKAFAKDLEAVIPRLEAILSGDCSADPSFEADFNETVRKLGNPGELAGYGLQKYYNYLLSLRARIATSQ